MLTIMAIIYGDLKDIPETRLKLYTECVDVLIRRKAHEEDMGKLDGMMPPPEFTLGELAYGLHQDSEKLSSGGFCITPPKGIFQKYAHGTIMSSAL